MNNLFLQFFAYNKFLLRFDTVDIFGSNIEYCKKKYLGI